MKIGIIGCGNMGQALLKGIIDQGYLARRNILCCEKDRQRLSSLRSSFKVPCTRSISTVAQQAEVIILAVKPQDAHTVLADLKTSLKGKLLISICAGLSTGKLEQYLGRVAVVRVMPNMPGLINQAISAICLGKYAKQRHQRLTRSIFSCIGDVLIVKEQKMDAVTAISGSGPAYFFYLTEKLIAAAQKLGLPLADARQLVIKTCLGSALLLNQSKQSPRALRNKVASKGGTTQAAFSVFRKKGWDKILFSAVQAAAKRSRQLRPN
ncbi:MAG: pyrroline-5-carboxylate reductase [Candidatus Omnitrophica bacterium]|nr:pyrroline-5-carboxylate reductase [Candidatus Omnitrophota bacterium]